MNLALWMRELRLHQWAKNLLIFVPVFLAGRLAEITDFLEAGIAFLVFGLLASTGYVINDLLDLETDRQHRTKRNRPFASGALPVAQGIWSVPLLLTVALLLSFLLPWSFAGTAVAYFAGTLAYSLRLKSEPLVDVLMLGGLFTIRVLAGAMLLETPVSFWLLTFAMFMFLSLALVKRYAELYELQQAGGSVLEARGYGVADLPLLLATGVATAVAANVIFVIYLVNEQFPKTIYTQPAWLWLVFPVLMLWIMRIWRLAAHGRMDEDPVFFALRDRTSLKLGAAVLLIVLFAW